MIAKLFIKTIFTSESANTFAAQQTKQGEKKAF